MTTVEALRDAHQRTIDQNPVEITIHRTGSKSDGAGGTLPIDEDLPPFTGRLIPTRSSNRTVEGGGGTLQLSAWVLLAPHETDIQHSTDVDDTFHVDGRKYRVRQVTRRKWQDEEYAVQAVAEEVS